MSLKLQNIYLIGIKGVGMTMLAQFLAAQGHQVSGSDIKDTFLTDQVLKRAKIKVFSPFSPSNFPQKIDLIIHSSAFNQENNVEIAYLKNNFKRFKNIPLLSYAQALGELFNQYQGIAICGSHGKTTVAAWLGYILWKAGKAPNVLVGSRVPQFQGSSLRGSSKLFIAEVDEYQNKLQYFQPQGVLLNNIDYDHPDFFKTPADYHQVFVDFIKKIPVKGFLVINNDDLESQKIKKYCRGQVITSGFKNKADYQALNLRQKNGQQFFQVLNRTKNLGEFQIKLLGEHNVANALAVIAAARQLKVSIKLIKKYLASFTGTERRSQILGKYRGALIIDDYAHHPTEIKTTLQGLKVSYPRKNIITVFHPHTFTRTKALFKNFITSFPITQELIILDIYGSAREKQGGVSSRQLVQKIIEFNQRQGIEQKVINISSLKQAAQYLKSRLNSQDLLVLMGAGDVFRIGQELLKRK